MIELSAEEKQAILMSDEFHKFFDRSTCLIERAMCEDYQRYITNKNKRPWKALPFPIKLMELKIDKYFLAP